MNDQTQIIETRISDETSILSPFSGAKPTISGEFADYLDRQLPHPSKTGELELVFVCETITKEEEATYESAIKTHYESELQKTEIDVKRNGVGSLIMLILGSIFLSLVITMTSLKLSEVLTGIFDILAWVFVWEAMDLFFFRRRELTERRKKCQAVLAAKVLFKQKAD